jgi:hypothetical protein
MVRLDLQESQVGFGISTDDARLILLGIRHTDRDLFRVPDDVIVRDDVAVFTDYETRPQTPLRSRWRTLPCSEEALEKIFERVITAECMRIIPAKRMRPMPGIRRRMTAPDAFHGDRDIHDCGRY